MLAALGSRVGRPGGLPPKPHCSPWADRERLLAERLRNGAGERKQSMRAATARLDLVWVLLALL